jgi:FMN phosphatase YigB (HAD superfamily)/DNA-binding Xre family transcriptional regulator
MDEKGLGRRLQEVRRSSGLTQQELCQKAGLSYSTLAKIERGAIKSPSIFTIRSIAEALHVSLDELLGVSPATVKSSKKTSRSGVKFVYFDVNGCMVRFAHRGFNKIADASGVPLDSLENVFWEFDDQVCRGDKSLDELNAALTEVAGVPVDWQESYLDAVESIQGGKELVKWAGESYYIGLLTNSMPGFIEAMRAREIIPMQHFDAVIDSSEVHALKPEAAIYEAAEAATSCEPGEILLIDDSRANLIAAKRRGWHTIWFDYYRPEESISSIRQALEPAD